VRGSRSVSAAAHAGDEVPTAKPVSRTPPMRCSTMRIGLARSSAGDLLAVLDAQHTLFSAQDQLAQVALNRLRPPSASTRRSAGAGVPHDVTLSPR
jgi:hypothetical protein